MKTKSFTENRLVEHITIVTEPEANYFNHQTPNFGSIQDSTNSIVKSLKHRNVNSDNKQVVGWDGTNVNTDKWLELIDH